MRQNVDSLRARAWVCVRRFVGVLLKEPIVGGVWKVECAGIGNSPLN